jgi:hypothetical protein
MLKTNAPEWGRLVDCVQMAFNKGDPSYFAKRRDYVALEIENLSLKEKLEKSQCGVNPSYIKSEGASGDKLSLKNEKERKEWLKRFRSWGVWIEVPELDQSYYRYNFANGTSLIVLVANSFNVWSDSTSHSFELIRYSIIDDKRSSYDSSGVSFSDVVNWLTKNSSLI